MSIHQRGCWVENGNMSLAVCTPLSLPHGHFTLTCLKLNMNSKNMANNMHSAFTVMSLTFVYDFKEDFQLVWVCVCVCVYVYACECVISTYPSNVEDSVQIIYFKWSV